MYMCLYRCVCVCVCLYEDVAVAIGATGWDTTIKPYQRSSSPVQRFELLVTQALVKRSTSRDGAAPRGLVVTSRRSATNDEKKQAEEGEKRSLTLAETWPKRSCTSRYARGRGQRTLEYRRWKLAGAEISPTTKLLRQFLRGIHYATSRIQQHGFRIMAKSHTLQTKGILFSSHGTHILIIF